MGAEQFAVTSTGRSATEAFMDAVKNAEYMHGHGGYTGTIAEKHDFTEIEVPEGRDPIDFARELLNESDPRVDDKWGPAGCILLEKRGDEGKYLFFGWASS